MRRYAIVIEKAANNYGGYVPDLPGCIATGATVEETEQLLREAIELHVEGMKEDGLPVPEPSSIVEYVELSVYTLVALAGTSRDKRFLTQRKEHSRLCRPAGAVTLPESLRSLVPFVAPA
jgi:predicted RNase H-like HicB family nuclease